MNTKTAMIYRLSIDATVLQIDQQQFKSGFSYHSKYLLRMVMIIQIIKWGDMTQQKFNLLLNNYVDLKAFNIKKFDKYKNLCKNGIKTYIDTFMSSFFIVKRLTFCRRYVTFAFSTTQKWQRKSCNSKQEHKTRNNRSWSQIYWVDYRTRLI